MTNDMQAADPQSPPQPLGNRFKLARETLGFSHQDAATQLRLSEKFIVMMENGNYPADLPITFIRGYQRAYAKLLHIPEGEIKEALEPIIPEPLARETVIAAKPPIALTSTHYFMQIFTSLIMMTLLGLIGMWWYTHTQTSSLSVALPEPESLSQKALLPETLSQESISNKIPQMMTDTTTTLALNQPIPTATPPAIKPVQKEVIEESDDYDDDDQDENDNKS